ncbi:hypothetical protein VTO42DRAFT_4990 [Malbranchea cinnamomea]
MVAPERPLYQKDEVVLCYHGDILYEAKILDIRKTDNKKSPFEYRVHYKGWKNTWDDWVVAERLRKNTEDNRELAATLRREAEALMRNRAKTSAKKRGLEAVSRNSEDRQSTSGKGTKRSKDNEIEKEDQFHARPSVRIVLPDTLRALLVDDWENITKNLQIVSLPAAVSVNKLLKMYMDDEKPNRKSVTEVDILEEVVAGLKEYFEKAVGRILLYLHEREQYRYYRNKIDKGQGPFKGMTMCDLYGAEHMARLLAVMPELLAQTNMSVQATNRAREELTKFSIWMSKNAEKLFANKYYAPRNDFLMEVPREHGGTATSQLLTDAQES